MSEDPGRDVVIFTAALQLPIEGRAAFLEQACLGDETLRREVEALLEAHERVGDFLEKPPFGLEPGAQGDEGSGEGTGNSSGNDGHDDAS